MAGTKISELTELTTPTGEEELVYAKDGQNGKIKVKNISSGGGGAYLTTGVIGKKYLSLNSGGSSSNYQRVNNGTLFTITEPGEYKLIYNIALVAYNADALLKIGSKQYKIPASVGIAASPISYYWNILYHDTVPVDVEIVSGCGDSSDRSGALEWMQIFKGDLPTLMTKDELIALDDYSKIITELSKDAYGYYIKLDSEGSLIDIGGRPGFTATIQGTTYNFKYYEDYIASYKGTQMVYSGSSWDVY